MATGRYQSLAELNALLHDHLGDLTSRIRELPPSRAAIERVPLGTYEVNGERVQLTALLVLEEADPDGGLVFERVL